MKDYRAGSGRENRVVHYQNVRSNFTKLFPTLNGIEIYERKLAILKVQKIPYVIYGMGTGKMPSNIYLGDTVEIEVAALVLFRNHVHTRAASWVIEWVVSAMEGGHGSAKAPVFYH